MNIDELETEVNKNLFESDLTLYDESINRILSFFQNDMERYNVELVDLMQETLDNKHSTYVKGFLDFDQKIRILNFVEYQWNAVLAKMRSRGVEKPRIDSMISNLLDILSLIAPMDKEVKKMLETFLAIEKEKEYKNWIAHRLDNLRESQVM